MFEFFIEKVAKLFGGNEWSPYLCTRFWEKKQMRRKRDKVWTEYWNEIFIGPLRDMLKTSEKKSINNLEI